jgi:hypothetical protein
MVGCGNWVYYLQHWCIEIEKPARLTLAMRIDAACISTEWTLVCGVIGVHGGI